MKIATLKSLAAKFAISSLAVGAFFLASPAKSQAQQFAVGVQFGQPAYVVDRDDHHYDPDRYRAQEYREQEQREAYARQQAYQRERWEAEQREAYARQQAYQREAYARQQAYGQHEYWEHHHDRNDYR